MEEIGEVVPEEEVESVAIDGYKHKKMTRKIAVILFAAMFTVLLLIVDTHRDFNLLLTSRLMQVLFILSFSVVLFYKWGKIRDQHLFHEVVDTASIIQVFLLLFTIVNYQFASISTVEGSSMEPNFYEDDNIIISHLSGSYERFDVVVIEMDDKVYYIKRVVGLPGDYVELIDNQLYVNGIFQDQVFLQDENGQLINQTVCDVFGETTCAFTVPEGEYFVLGDNRENSEDSRIFGPVDYEQVEGKVVYKFRTLFD